MQDLKIILFDALTEASQWDLFLLDNEKSEMTYTEARRKVVERIFSKFSDKFVTETVQPEKFDEKKFIEDLCDRIKNEFA